ncbi:hypothetical protein L1987_49601 [Smallanthus sonchifolius]|uniref:Uncharacterized protein n=1 Tax=Smallanthus sonchifolius TaxID=185202 RepID=A0ACB9FVR2_9ASTR|nr:hypothetical protein L1987_49601 [Smallanthus sonchifolius]
MLMLFLLCARKKTCLKYLLHCLIDVYNTYVYSICENNVIIKLFEEMSRDAMLGVMGRGSMKWEQTNFRFGISHFGYDFQRFFLLSSKDDI